MKRHHHRHRSASHKNGRSSRSTNSRSTIEIYSNQRPLGFNYLNAKEEPVFDLNAPTRVNEVLNASRYQVNKTRKYKNTPRAEERPLKLATTRIPTNTRKQVRAVRQMQQQQMAQLKLPNQRVPLNTIAEGRNETKTPKTPLPFRTSYMPNTPNPANYNLIFGKW